MASFDWIAAELATLDKQDLRRQRRQIRPLPGGKCRIEERVLWNFATNDYLGLADDPRLAHAAQQAIQESGLGARASPLVTGRTRWHVALERALAEFKQAEAAVLFPTGYAANLGTIPALAGREDVVFCDRLNHASLIDGCRLSQARLRVYPHCDLQVLRRELAKAHSFRRRLIVTDSLFSMDGDQAPLPALANLAEEFQAILLVDEAHATGVYGPMGTGLLEAQNVQSDRIVAVGTLSKGIGIQGGFVAGSQELVDWLWNSARTQVFSTALAIPLCAAAVAALKIIQTEPERRQRLLHSAELVRETLTRQGWEIPRQSQGVPAGTHETPPPSSLLDSRRSEFPGGQTAPSPIIPVIVGDALRTVKLATRLEQQGILVAAIRPPTVPRGTARLRISLGAQHHSDGIDALLQAMQRIGPSPQ